MQLRPRQQCFCDSWPLTFWPKNKRLSRLDAKRPDGLTLIPRQGGKSLTLDVTVVSTLILNPTYIPCLTLPAALLKPLLYCQEGIEVLNHSAWLHFQPIAIETHGPLNASALNFLSEVGRRLSSISGDLRETLFLFQRLSVIVQHLYNSVLIMDSCTTDENPDLYSPVIF